MIGGEMGWALVGVWDIFLVIPLNKYLNWGCERFGKDHPLRFEKVCRPKA